MSILLPSRRIVSAYPAGRPEIEWDNPLAKGLLGFLWCGGPVPVDLVSPLTRFSYTGVTVADGGRGPRMTVAATPNGVSTPRNSVVPLGNWVPAQTPVSLFGYFGHATSASTRGLAGTGLFSGGGINLAEAYGNGSRYGRATVGGASRDVQGGVWSSGEAVRGLVVSGTEVVGYDNGQTFGQSATYASTSLSYDANYSRVFMLGHVEEFGVVGTGYWLALWARLLHAGEARSLALAPFQLLRATSTRRVFLGGAGSSNVTATVAGASATAAGGAVQATGGASATVAGAGTTTASGTVQAAGGASATLVGTSATAASGTVQATGGASAIVVGAAGAGAAGSVSATTGGGVVAVVLGASGVAACGTLQATGGASAAVTGAAATARPGVVGASTVAGTTAVIVGAWAQARAGVVMAGDIEVLGATVIWDAPAEDRIYDWPPESRIFAAPAETRIYEGFK